MLEIGQHNVGGIKYAYELHMPSEMESGEPPGEANNGESSSFPLVVIIHGFNGSLKNHRVLAEYWSGLSCIVLVPTLANMMAVLQSSRHQLRRRGIDAVCDFVRWLAVKRNTTGGDPLHNRIDRERIGLVGHSAGGAIVYEASCLLQAENVCPPRAICLFDGVPWLHTIDRARNNELLATTDVEAFYQRDTVVDGDAEERSRCVICSLRAEESSYNANGLVLELLAQATGSFMDILIPGAKHADFADDAYKSLLLRCMGLASSEGTQARIRRISTAFFVTTLLIDLPEYAAHQVGVDKTKYFQFELRDLSQKKDIVVREKLTKENLPPKLLSKMPAYLK